MLESRTIWATHYLDLNDHSEIVLLKAPLAAALEVNFREVLRTRMRHSLQSKLLIQKRGGIIKLAKAASEGLVRSFYSTTFDETNLGQAAFLTSFCTHASPEQAYERKNGLLSQWRGYSRQGGFSIVFDTKRLGECLGAEFSSYFYTHINIGVVHYATGDTSINQLLPELLALSEQFLTAMLENPISATVREEMFGAFVSGATLYKHQGFREECEVRIVAMPGSTTLRARLKEEEPAFVGLPLRPVDKHNGKRHISLPLGELPIRRIIVGPSRNQRVNHDDAHSIIGDSIPICMSDTPYIG